MKMNRKFGMVLATLGFGLVSVTWVSAHDQAFENSLTKNIAESKDENLAGLKEQIGKDKKTTSYLANTYGPGGIDDVLQQLLNYAYKRGGAVSRAEYCSFLSVLDKTYSSNPKWAGGWNAQKTQYADAADKLLGGFPCVEGKGAFLRTELVKTEGAIKQIAIVLDSNKNKFGFTVKPKPGWTRDFMLDGKVVDNKGEDKKEVPQLLKVPIKVGPMKDGAKAAATELVILHDSDKASDRDKSNLGELSAEGQAMVKDFAGNPAAYDVMGFEMVDKDALTVVDSREQLVKRATIKKGYFVTKAPNGKEGVALFQTEAALDVKKAKQKYPDDVMLKALPSFVPLTVPVPRAFPPKK